ncbi:Retrovirus-related Pol polyprotein from transposon opus [Gossypium australe]|uniref:Retrovirus-related Pol polyprotein from transposon opus n=1 Tax=Gossypium australe TaxID=47621 RepID=A0A5B6WTS4_9ROSI|nr:Retrovirus-related Pol polyprotein from transposon opus [Gossypium australe]
MLKQNQLVLPIRMTRQIIYNKFMKGHRHLFLSDSRSLRCTTMLMNKLPPKMKDPESFTILCSIGNHYVGKAKCDLDRSYAYPEGKIEDVLVKVEIFIFPADFIILECEVDKEVPIILGRPFVAIGRRLIDV